MTCASLNRAVFIKNLLRYLAEKILLLNTTNFRGDYQGGAFDDFYPGDEDAASDAALDFVYSSLEGFGIRWEVAAEIVSSVDIADILNDNFVADAKSWEHNLGSEEAGQTNDLDAAIIDLFDRD